MKNASGAASFIFASARGIELDSPLLGNITNAGTIHVSAKATSLNVAGGAFVGAFVRAVRARTDMIGDIKNSGKITAVAAAKSRRAISR